MSTQKPRETQNYMMTEVEQACRYLLLVWEQYGRSERIGGRLYLGHSHMYAGQEAGDFLIARGYAESAGEGILVTKQGEDLMERDE